MGLLFTSTAEISPVTIKKAVLLVKKKGIVVNTDLKKQRICSNQAVVIKKISMNMPKDIIVIALAKFGEIKSIKIQLIGLWQKAVAEHLAAKWFFLIGKDLVCMTMAVEGHCLWLVKLYAKKGVSISKPAAFGGKFWAQMVSLAFLSSGLYFDSGFGFSPLSSGSSKLLANQMSDIVHRLNSVELVLITQVVLLATSVSILALPDTNMVLDVSQLSFLPFFSVLKDKVVDLGLSSSKVPTLKVGSLESKIMALKVSIGSILGKLDLLCINLGSLMYFLHQ
ncbi:hypothetical protein G9A89_023350 [Geosiphon pyriformis]|nr:hypothetical protein G9A89_023350 [Geosiphon pyriformis]